jgi:hypothetical protein
MITLMASIILTFSKDPYWVDVICLEKECVHTVSNPEYARGLYFRSCEGFKVQKIIKSSGKVNVRCDDSKGPVKILLEKT